MPKVLIFESDPTFAHELRRGLEQYSCAVTVVGDATEGLQLAAAARPDLILLTVELPRINGFSVCNKLKRDPGLKSVPLIIMSSDSNEETFAQHRRLKNSRAEDYVHKPVSFEALLPRIHALVPLDSAESDRLDVVLDEVVHIAEPGEEAPPVDGYLELEPDLAEEDTQFDTEIEAELELEDVESIAPEAHVDAEVDEFTEHAFDALLDADEIATQTVDQAPLVASAEDDADDPDTKVDATRSVLPGTPLPASPGSISMAPESVASRPPRSRSSELSPRLSESQALAALDPRALAARDEDIVALETQLASAQADVERQRAELADLGRQCVDLERQLTAARDEVAPSVVAVSGGSPQEFLSLREALNKKDKEILELHGQVSQKSKELLSVKDASLGYEREKTDAIDRLLQVERELQELSRVHNAIKADKEQAGKRADDFKRRCEKLARELEDKDQAYTEQRDQLLALEQSRRADIEEAEARGQSALSEANARHEAQICELTQRHETLLAAAEQGKQEALGQASERARADLSAAIERGSAELAEATERYDAALAAAEQSKQAALGEALERAEAALAAAEQSKQAALGEATERAEAALRAVEAREREALEQVRRQAQEKLAAVLAEARAEHTRVVEQANAEYSRALEQANAERARQLAEQQTTAARERSIALEHQEARLKTEYEQALALLVDEKNAEQSVLTAERDAALSRAEREIGAARAATREVQTELASVQSDLATAREALALTGADLERERARFETSNADLAQTRANLDQTRSELEQDRTRLEAAGRELGERSDQLQRMERDLASTRGELERAREEVQVLQSGLSDARSELTTTQTSLSASERDLTATREQLAQTELELRETSAELATSIADRTQLQSEFSRVQAKASAALSKWEQDRDAIHKGREALQAALEQLTQIEGRPLN